MTILIPFNCLIQTQAVVLATEFSIYVWTVIAETETAHCRNPHVLCLTAETTCIFYEKLCKLFPLCFSKFLQHLQSGHVCSK